MPLKSIERDLEQARLPISEHFLDKSFLSRLIRKLAKQISQLLPDILITESEPYQKLQSLLGKDSLTQLSSREIIVAELDATLKTIQRNPTDIYAFITLDIDNFKLINTHKGHAGANDILRKMGAALNTKKRPKDCISRIGGDEFAGIFRVSGDFYEAMITAFHLGEVLSDLIKSASGITVSMGIKIISMEDIKPFALNCEPREIPLQKIRGLIYRAADEALYHAKESRDRISMARDDLEKFAAESRSKPPDLSVQEEDLDETIAMLKPTSGES